MIAELGLFTLILALAASLAQACLLFEGVRRGDAAWMAAGRHAAVVHALLVGASFAALAASFLADDVTVRTVAAHSHSLLPAAWRAAAVWSGHEGSMLLWTTALGLWTVALRAASDRLPPDLSCRALGVLALVSSAFLVLVIATSNPFARILPGAVPGRDLNPLLQDPAMVLHPPLVTLGYTGFAVVFALLLAAMPGGRLDAAWARWSRPWALAAWCFLTLGIGAGSVGAYREPGWGGWWSWDPVQVASLMPWLAGTALLHSLAVTERRGLFRRWTALLAILAFSLSLLGAFIAPPDALSSVHDFAPDPRRGLVFLVLLFLVVTASLAFYARLARDPDGLGHFEMISREAALAAGNVALLAALGAVLLGTIYPFVAEGLGMHRVWVGPSYFASVFLPLVLPGLVLLGPGPRLRWGSEAAGDALRDAIRPAAVATAAAAFAVLGAPRAAAWVAVGVFVSAWIAWHVLEAIAFRWRRDAGRGPWRTIASPPASFYAMHVAHLGVALLVAGVTLSSGHQQSVEVVLAPGATETLSSLSLRSEGTREVDGPNYRAVRVRIVALEDGREVVLEPEKRFYRTRAMPTTESAVHSGLARDLHVSLAEALPGGAWVVRVRVRPFMSWAWGGAFLMVMGGLVAAVDRRLRAWPPDRVERMEPALASTGSALP